MDAQSRMNAVIRYPSLDEAPPEIHVHFAYMRQILQANADRPEGSSLHVGLHLHPDWAAWTDIDQAAHFGYRDGPIYTFDREHQFVGELRAPHTTIVYNANGTIAYAARSPWPSKSSATTASRPLTPQPHLN